MNKIVETLTPLLDVARAVIDPLTLAELGITHPATLRELHRQWTILQMLTTELESLTAIEDPLEALKALRTRCGSL